MNPRLALLCLLSALTALRWSWNLGLPLSPGNAYLAICGTIPSVAYFDGPGGTALSVALGVSMFGANALGAAFFWPIYAMVATLALYSLVLPMAGPRSAASLAVLLNILPVFNHATLEPDSALPLTASALGALACAWRGLDKNSVLWWLVAGCVLACGLFFSYGAWLPLPAIFLAMIASRRWRPRLARPGFWLACIPPLIVFSALLAWNSDHGWVHFIGNTMATALLIDWSRFPVVLAAAAGSVGPLGVVALALAVWFALREVTVSPKIKFLVLPALCSLMAWLYSGLRGLPGQTTGLLATVMILPLLVCIPSRLGRLPTRVLMTAVLIASAFWTVGTLARSPREQGFIDSEVVKRLEEITSSFASDKSHPLFLIAEDAPIASAFAVNLSGQTFTHQSGHPPVYSLESAFAESQYALWPRYDQFVEATQAAAATFTADPFTEQEGANPFVGRSALYITCQKPDDLPQAITAAFAGWHLAAEISAANGQILRIYLCSDYQTMPL